MKPKTDFKSKPAVKIQMHINLYSIKAPQTGKLLLFFNRFFFSVVRGSKGKQGRK